VVAVPQSGSEGWFIASLILALADGKSYTQIEGE
jgi:hypothetical protein